MRPSLPRGVRARDNRMCPSSRPSGVDPVGRSATTSTTARLSPLTLFSIPCSVVKVSSCATALSGTFGHGLHSIRRLSGRYETISWWMKTDDYTWNLDPIRTPAKYPGKRHFKGANIGKLSGNPKGKNPSDVWEFPNVKHNHPEKTMHPCQFLVELVERLVLSMTNVGDTVFDRR